MMIKLKKVEEMDYYEVLNLARSASQKEIENAYLVGIATYSPDSLASYRLVSGEERKFILRKLEEAFQTLSNSEKRKVYDSKIQPNGPEADSRAYFRKTVEKLEIEDADKPKTIWAKLKSLVFPDREKRETQEKTSEVASPNIANPNLYRGVYLKKVRQNRGLTLEEIAKATKIHVSYLEALEEENYKRLPKGIDVSHLLKLYARCLGLHFLDK